MKQIADEHMEYLERKHMVKMLSSSPIRISQFTLLYKIIDVPASNYLQPIRVRTRPEDQSLYVYAP